MTNTGLRHRPDRKPAMTALFALIGAAFGGAACAGQSLETAETRDASVIMAQAVAPGDSIKDEAPALTALVRAAHYGEIEAAERQLGEGVDVNAVSALGMTPLMWSFQPLILPPTGSGDDPAEFQASLARQKRKLQIARMLLDRGADIALVDGYGMTALHYLALMDGEERPLIEILQAFMAKGADPNVSNIDRTTPLMFAAYRNRPQLVKALLSAGADPRATAKDGHTALSIARERGYSDVVEVLEQHIP